MILSLREWIPDSQFIVLCIDRETEKRLQNLKLPNVIPKHINDVLDNEVLELQDQRTLAEFCWTLTPLALEIGLEHSKDGAITYLDADLFFFSSPEKLLKKIRQSNKSIAITPHDFSSHLEHLEIFGNFCVQWITIFDDKYGRECLAKYKDQCIDWCYAYIDKERFGDQKYLDVWPEIYGDNLIILEPKSGFAAPWNFNKYNFEYIENQGYFFGKKKLIFFHFHQFKIFSSKYFFWCSNSYGSKNIAIKSMYKHYEKAILNSKRILTSDYNADIQSEGWYFFIAKRFAKDLIPVSLRNVVKNLVTNFRRV